MERRPDLLRIENLSMSQIIQVNQVFDILKPEKIIDVGALVLFCIVFAPGPLDIIQASTPPALSFFKALPTDCVKIWAIYKESPSSWKALNKKCLLLTIVPNIQ
jgi:hypothetical protein